MGSIASIHGLVLKLHLANLIFQSGRQSLANSIKNLTCSGETDYVISKDVVLHVSQGRAFCLSHTNTLLGSRF